jgi:hypothetical protein
VTRQPRRTTCIQLGRQHPADLHKGNGDTIRTARQAVLDSAYTTHPERFINQPPTAPDVPVAAWINKPTINTQLD